MKRKLDFRFFRVPQHLQGWVRAIAGNRRRSLGRSRRAAQLRTFDFEPLEDRALLAVLTVNSAADNLTAGDGLVTLREAIIAANTDVATDLGDTGSGADTIVFDPSLDGTPITLSIVGADEDAAATGDLDITSDITIEGNGQTKTIIQAGTDATNGIDRVFHVLPGNTVAINKLTIRHGNISGEGGGIFNDESTLSITRTTISENTAAGGAGGGIYNYAYSMGSTAVLAISDSVISGNSAGSGGGVFNYAGYGMAILTINCSTISDNMAGLEAGGVFNYGSLGTAEATISHSTISGNSAGRDGGGIVNYGDYYDSIAALTVMDSIVTGNSAEDEGGGIYQTASDGGAATLNIIRSTISENTSVEQGGGIKSYADGEMSTSVVTVADSTISGNTTSYKGGGIFNKADDSGNASLSVLNSTISGNQAVNYGGGIYNYSEDSYAPAPLTIINSTISGNRSDTGDDGGYYGGGLYTYYGMETIINSIIAGNFRGTGTTPDDIGGDDDDADDLIENANNNLIGDAATSGGIVDGMDGNMVGNAGTGTIDITTVLDTTLQGNGGTTETHALVAGSPAIDMGDNGLIPTDVGDQDADMNTTEPVPFDQRGMGIVRVFNSTVDIGAFEVQGAAIGPEINVQGRCQIIAGGDTTPDVSDDTDFGTAAAGSGEITYSFTIQNTGDADLTLTGTPIVAISGSSDFTVSVQPATSTLAPIGITTFAVTFTPATSGIQSATISIANDDSDENPYDFLVQGEVIAAGGGDSFVVTTALDENDGTSDPGTGAGTSLREAIIAANADPDVNVITFDPSLDGMPITLTIADSDEDAAADGDLDITSAVTIQGNGETNTIIQAGTDDTNGISRVFHILAGSTVEINDMTIRHGQADDGAGIYQSVDPDGASTLTINNSTISSNSASDDGGGIQQYADENAVATMTINNSTISGNSAEESGGGIYQYAFVGTAVMTINNSSIEGNTAGDYGGGISQYADNEGSATLTITGSTISGNSAADEGGGGIDQRAYDDASATLIVTDSTISGNMAAERDADGGGIRSRATSGDNSTVSVTITGSTISDNTAGDYGGGIFQSADEGFATLVVNNSTISGNTAIDGGGGIYHYADFGSATLVLTGSTISGNYTYEEGGGIAQYADSGSASLTINNSTISGNTAGDDGGGIHQDNGGGSLTLEVNNSTVTGNRADADGDGGGFEFGGGIYTTGDSDTLNNSIVAGNFVGISPGTTADDISGTIETANNNLIGDAATSGGIMDGDAGNKIGNGGSGTIDINTVLDTTLAD